MRISASSAIARRRHIWLHTLLHLLLHLRHHLRVSAQRGTFRYNGAALHCCATTRSPAMRCLTKNKLYCSTHAVASAASHAAASAAEKVNSLKTKLRWFMHGAALCIQLHRGCICCICDCIYCF
jgi:hypothetical protein